MRDHFILDLNGELIVDNFAGGGGASTGIEMALGRHVDIAINHDLQAVQMHEMNHPQTKHYREDVFKVDPLTVTKGRPVGLAWFSPDCKHFSKAKGGKPKSKKIRGLAWIMVKWAKLVQPRVMILENVEEFKTWGPLLRDGSPCPKRKGKTYRSFIAQLQALGYVIETKELRACDYGAPTIRKRFFLIARRDGNPIVWPEPTHGDPASKEVKSRKLKPWLTAADCIDFTLPCPSIFLSRTEGRKLGVKRPLVEASMRRIARGTWKFVIENKEPFIVTLNHQGNHFRGQGLPEPFKTVCGAHDAHGLVLPSVAPFLTEHSNGSKQRIFKADESLRTQCAEVKGGHFALVSAFLASYKKNVHAQPLTGPTHTFTTKESQSLIAAHLVRQFGQSVGSHPESPVGSITADGAGKVGLVTSFVSKMRGDNLGHKTDEPVQTVSAQGTHFAEVRAFLCKYYGTGDCNHQACDGPMHTVRAGDGISLVTVKGIKYAIIDLGMRMLIPRELYRAQGFPESYIIDFKVGKKMLSKKAQVRMCGNSVCPPLARALVAANVPEMAITSASRWEELAA